MDVTNVGLIERAMRKCLAGKWGRESVHRLLAEHCELAEAEVAEIVRSGDRSRLDGALQSIALEIAEHIKRRDLMLPPVHQFSAKDRSSGKVRTYCEEAIIRQMCNYVAIEGLMPLFNAKIGAHQCASLVGRGQRYGQKLLEKWVRCSPKMMRHAVQADIRKAYPSTDIERLKQMLQRDVKNDALLWLTFLLLDGMPEGLSIGSYLSMFLCNYMMSYAWREGKSNIYKLEWKRGKNGVYKRRRKPLIDKVLIYMDDLLLCGANKRDLLRGFWELCKFLRKKLGYHVKRSWRRFKTHWVDRNGKQRGSFIDMMGVRVYQNRTTVRRRIFGRARRVYAKMERRVREHRAIPPKLAGRAISYYGWLLNTDSWKWLKQHVRRCGLMRLARRTVAFYANKRRQTIACAAC